jgi:hypothetical protein
VTTRRRIGFALAALAAGLIVIGIGGSAWRRGLEPKFEGRTAGAWLSHFSWQRASGLTDHSLVLKEAEAVFRSMGQPGQAQLVREVLTLESATGWRSNLQARATKRLRQGQWVPRINLLESPDHRRIVARDIVWHVRPSWSAMAEGLDGSFDPKNPTYNQARHLSAIQLIAYARRGSSNALPVLIQALESGDPNLAGVAVQTLRALEGDLGSALPTLLRLLEAPGLPLSIVETVGDFGPAATNALPLLRSLLENQPDDASKAKIAGAILKINRGDEEALSLLQALLESDNPANLRLITFGLLSGRITNNPAIADLGEQLLARSIALSPTFDSFALEILKQQAPDRAERFLEEYYELHGGSGLLVELLALNPQHEPALRILEETLTRNLTQPGWLVGNSGDQFLPLRHVLPEATNIVALLQQLLANESERKKQAKGDTDWETDLRTALRHIGLNGKLQSLRKRDASRGN